MDVLRESAEADETTHEATEPGLRRQKANGEGSAHFSVDTKKAGEDAVGLCLEPLRDERGPMATMLHER